MKYYETIHTEEIQGFNIVFSITHEDSHPKDCFDYEEEEMQELEFMPTLFSSESNEFIDENGNAVYTLRLFDEDLPELEFEEEVEILYKLLTKKEIYLK
jgi:hypothetical protein